MFPVANTEASIRYDVFTLVKSHEPLADERFKRIYSLDNALDGWWSMVEDKYKLTTENITSLPKHDLNNTLLVNVVFHQCKCALHASVVPLFSWTSSDNSWALARQASAQKTYEHAGAVSQLIGAILGSCPDLLITHSFLAYAAYSGCAVQIPFLWSSNATIQRNAASNVDYNTRIIQSMAPYWKFASLVVGISIHNALYNSTNSSNQHKQLGCLYRIHQRRSVDLDAEPRNLDTNKLLDFQINAKDARISILGFTEILRSRDRGYARSGEESNNLEIPDENSDTGNVVSQTLPPDPLVRDARVADQGALIGDMHQTMAAGRISQESRPGLPSSMLRSAQSMRHVSNNSSDQQSFEVGTTLLAPADFLDGADTTSQSDLGHQPYLVWQPFFHPNMLEDPGDAGMLDQSLPVDSDSLDWYYGDPQNWFGSSTGT
jgi:hypothetical protein